MSTRSDIIAKLPDGKWGRIYCHFDGYLSGVGATLEVHYSDPKKIHKLIKLGSVSSLEKSITKSVFYGRDRNEKNTGPSVAETLKEVWPVEDSWTEFTYVHDGVKWFVGNPRAGTESLKPLLEELVLDKLGREEVYD